MRKLGIFVCLILIFILAGFQMSGASTQDYYKTYEIIEITENGLTLQDSSGNTIEIDKAPKDYKVGYLVRYDKIRNRLHGNQWQEYTVTGVSSNTVSLQHKSGDTLSVDGYYMGQYTIGDQVRYNSVKGELKAVKASNK